MYEETDMEKGTEIQAWNQGEGDGQRCAKSIGEWGKEAQKLGRRKQRVRRNMLNMYVLFGVCLAPRQSERFALIALPFVVKHSVGEIASNALGCWLPWLSAFSLWWHLCPTCVHVLSCMKKRVTQNRTVPPSHACHGEHFHQPVGSPPLHLQAPATTHSRDSNPFLTVALSSPVGTPSNRSQES